MEELYVCVTKMCACVCGKVACNKVVCDRVPVCVTKLFAKECV